MPIERAGTVYYNLTEVSDHVGCSRTSVWRWKREEKIPQGQRYRDRELLFTSAELNSIYAYAHRMTSDEAAAAMKDQLKLKL